MLNDCNFLQDKPAWPKYVLTDFIVIFRNSDQNGLDFLTRDDK